MPTDAYWAVAAAFLLLAVIACLLIIRRQRQTIEQRDAQLELARQNDARDPRTGRYVRFDDSHFAGANKPDIRGY
jgi:hypothetical protein